MKAVVITCSDRADAGLYEDLSGPAAVQGLGDFGFTVSGPTVVPDEILAIQQSIALAVTSGARVVITTGGTGVGPRDVTPEATRPLLRYELPGIMEALRSHGAKNAPYAWLSRGLAGIANINGNQAVIINVPGSAGGASDAIEVAGPLLLHLVSQLDGGDHDDSVAT